ncbi:MAG: glycosyltransferase family 2 protein [Clostridium perfringens]|nr:glycosyltransferase family 2 protein [Clostridium perfringens]
MSITVICPLYKGSGYLDNLHKSIICQQNVKIKDIKYILTDTNDDTESKLKKLKKCNYTVVAAKDFSHSLTREKAAMEADSDICVFITQDIIITDKKWLYKLTKPLYENKCQATFSRQVCDNKSIEKYTRMKNYPNESRITSKKDTESLGIRAFFFSDAASAVNLSVYKKLNGYDGLDLLTNEDMYLAYKLINNGYKIMYNAEACVVHSHDYEFKTLFKRYFDQGVFLKDNSYLLDYKANDSAVDLLKFVAIESIKEKNLKAFLSIVPNFGARFLGNKFGQSYQRLSKEKVKRYSSNVNYWNRKYS